MEENPGRRSPLSASSSTRGADGATGEGRDPATCPAQASGSRTGDRSPAPRRRIREGLGEDARCPSCVPGSGCRSHAARSSSSWRTWRGIISSAREWPRRRRRHRRPRHPPRRRPSLRWSRQPPGYRASSWILCQAGVPRLFRCCSRHWRGKTGQAMQGRRSRKPRRAPGPNPTRRHRRPSRPRACPRPRRCRCRGPARADGLGSLPPSVRPAGLR